MNVLIQKKTNMFDIFNALNGCVRKISLSKNNFEFMMEAFSSLGTYVSCEFSRLVRTPPFPFTAYLPNLILLHLQEFTSS